VTLVVACALAAATGALLWLACRTTYEAPILQRRNYRGVDVPVGAGVVLVLAVVAIEGVFSVAEVLGRDVGLREATARWSTLVAALGFGLLGIFDDLAAHGDDRGFRGHLTGVLKGRLTTGGLKLFGGGLLAVVAVRAAGADDVAHLLVGAALVALAANLGNLFDRAPGRCTKVATIAVIALVIAAGAGERASLVGAVAVVGAGLGLIAFDLREELMLGDAGANVLGAALGLGVVLTSGLVVQAVVLVVVAALNLVSESVSFSRVIDSVAPLRWLDRLGRRPST
jgi:UDP-N-acetylmuramyl pentapeptide phosphotransferase/UDP-N-acetylglucosamine-1-phosphate transferase